MQISETAGGQPAAGVEPCRFPKLEECAHFHYERVRLQTLSVHLCNSMDKSLHSQHTNEHDDGEWYMIQVTSGEACWLLQRNFENFKMLDAQLHQCIYDRRISQLPDLSLLSPDSSDIEAIFMGYLERFSQIVDNSLNCGPVLNWLQMDNKGHRLLVPSEESRSINTPAVAAAYSVRRYVSQARDELNLEVGDMISVIDMASPGESMWWRGKRGFQVGFFPQHCVHIIGDKVPRNMPLPPPVVGSLAITSIKPVLRKHGKLITFFRSFILNRPSRRRLKQTGILKERVFACDLGEHLLNSGHEIPMVLKYCAEFIETNGIVDGIYRLSGITSNIQKLRNAFDEDRIPNLYTDDILQDIHSVASLLKMYFRELPNPLCTYQLYQSFVNAVQNTKAKGAEGDHERLLKMREAVQKLPPPHYRTLQYLMRHLARVAKHGASTGMTTRNVAIVWAPNLLRCAELEDGGVTALQGVGVQAVVTEFLICFADLIFCDYLPNLDKSLLGSNTASPKRSRPKSLAISTPTKLITLEEARSKHLSNNRNDECDYIEVGGGPKNLPKKYHTIIELPAGTRKRGHTKRSPLGWRSFFAKSRSALQSNTKTTRKSSTPGIDTSEKSITAEPELLEVRLKLRSVKSAESLTSGHSEPGPNDVDILGPLHSLHKTSGHNRSISHDSYFDLIQNSQNNSEGSLLDLDEIQLNFDLEETEMRIFLEDESFVSSPKVLRESGQRKILTRVRPEEFSSAVNSENPSPKKQARVILSPGSISRKRTRLEDQLSDIQFIDCITPENTVNTSVLVHSEETNISCIDFYRPKNKSPRNSDNLEKRQSLNLEAETAQPVIVKSFTDNNIIKTNLGDRTATPQSPIYRPIGSSSTNSSSDSSPDDITYEHLQKSQTEYISPPKNIKTISPTYENVLTTISITYKSPARSLESSSLKTQVSDFDSIYEDVMILPEKAIVPTSTASLPIQQASQPALQQIKNSLDSLLTDEDSRPKSCSFMNVLEQDSNKVTIDLNSGILRTNELSLFSRNNFKTSSSNSLSDCNFHCTSTSAYELYDCKENTKNDADLNSNDLPTSNGKFEGNEFNVQYFPKSSRSLTLNVSPTSPNTDTQSEDLSTQFPLEVEDTNQCTSMLEIDSKVIEVPQLDSTNQIDLINFSPLNEKLIINTYDESSLEKEKSTEIDTNTEEKEVYEQVKYFRRSIHEINELLQLESTSKDKTVEDLRAVEVMEGAEEIFKISNNTTVNVPIKTADENSKITMYEEGNDDSLADDSYHIYENIGGEFMRGDLELSKSYQNMEVHRSSSVNEKMENIVSEDKTSIKDILVKFEKYRDLSCKSTVSNNCISSQSITTLQEVANTLRLKKFYEKDSLPPCLRARKLKNQMKTRSLDEDDFKKEFSLYKGTRRTSLDDLKGYKSNSLPKMLNQPKVLSTGESDKQIYNLHLSHSSENIVPTLEEEIRKRERIEKYKEERRKILQEKYRTESFKENKDVLLSRMKIYKPTSKEHVSENSQENSTRPKRIVRSEDSIIRQEMKPKNEEEEEPVQKNNVNKIKYSSLKVRAAVFEKNTSPGSCELSKSSKMNTSSGKDKIHIVTKDTKSVEMEEKDVDRVHPESFILRKKTDSVFKSERRRHTYESRERLVGSERLRRGSLDQQSPRKEKCTLPSYCIKDMKAIFESKSNH